MPRTLPLVLALWTPLPALAQEGSCEEKVDINWFIAGMDSIDQAFGSFEADMARTISNDLRWSLPCVEDPVHPNHLVRFARQRALAGFFDQDEAEMAYWGQLALLNPDVPWPELLASPDHPLRETLSFLEVGPILLVEEKGIAVPKGMAFLIDGKHLAVPEVRINTPHLVQILDRPGHVYESRWQDGTAFAADHLTSEPGPVDAPSWYAPPDPTVDPTKPVVIDPKELQHRARAVEEAKIAALTEAELRAKAEAAEKRRRERREAQAAKDAARKAALEAEAAASAPPQEVVPEYRAPETWLDFTFAGEREALDGADPLLSGIAPAAACDEILRLEPLALMGTLSVEQIQCLELRLRHEPLQTTRDRISRTLMADAWAKGEVHRWEGAVRRHLTTIGRSDADLCYIFALHLAKKGAGSYVEAIRWSNRAVENSLQWEGDTRVKRMYALRKMMTLAALELWLDASARALADRTPANKQRENFWRNQTKSFAKEWLDFAAASGADQEAPFDICVSAAGTVDYCKTE